MELEKLAASVVKCALQLSTEVDDLQLKERLNAQVKGLDGLKLCFTDTRQNVCLETHNILEETPAINVNRLSWGAEKGFPVDASTATITKKTNIDDL